MYHKTCKCWYIAVCHGLTVPAFIFSNIVLNSDPEKNPHKSEVKTKTWGTLVTVGPDLYTTLSLTSVWWEERDVLYFAVPIWKAILCVIMYIRYHYQRCYTLLWTALFMYCLMFFSSWLDLMNMNCIKIMHWMEAFYFRCTHFYNFFEIYIFNVHFIHVLQYSLTFCIIMLFKIIFTCCQNK